jgi:hypothetical protein
MMIDVAFGRLIKSIALALAMIVSAVPAQGSDAETKAIPRAEQTENRDDLLGLRLGTAAVTARQFLERRGFTMTGFQAGPSWYALVGKQTKTSIDRRYRGSISAASFQGPNGEVLALDFVQIPGGAALSRAVLQLPETFPEDRMRAELLLAYGNPNCGQGWCPTSRDKQIARLSPSIMPEYSARTVTLDAGKNLALLEAHSVREAVRNCNLERLGVDLGPGYFLGGCR